MSTHEYAIQVCDNREVVCNSLQRSIGSMVALRMLLAIAPLCMGARIEIGGDDSATERPTITFGSDGDGEVSIVKTEVGALNVTGRLNVATDVTVSGASLVALIQRVGQLEATVVSLQEQLTPPPTSPPTPPAPPALPPPLPPPFYSLLHADADCMGQETGLPASGASLDECADLCAAQVGCVFFIYRHSPIGCRWEPASTCTPSSASGWNVYQMTSSG